MAKLVSYWDEIYKEQFRNAQLYEAEDRNIGGYEKRYEDLEPFRSALNAFAEGRVHDNTISPKITILENGHVLDHHVLGYLAPMEFMRTGFGNIKRTPVEQLLMLNDQLKEKDIRFIYVALPCKLAIYPELVNSKISSIIPSDGLLIPHWRKMLQKLNNEGLEMIDCYDAFFRMKNDKCLFSKNHHISPFGARIIADEISQYIIKTTILPSIVPENTYYCTKKSIRDNVLRISGDYASEKLGEEIFEADCVTVLECERQNNVINEVKSEICIIGNCNLQSYRGLGCDITSYLSYLLKYPVLYGGRYLPFAKIDSIDKIPRGTLSGKKILIYVGFISASFVRAYRSDDVWSVKMIQSDAFC